MPSVDCAAPEWARTAWRQWFSAARACLGVNRREFAKKVGIHSSWVSYCERGLVPSRKLVDRIGTAYGDRNGALIAAGYVPDEATQMQLLADQGDARVSTA